MSSIAEELDVTSEANLLYIGLTVSTDRPHPDAPEHANVRTASELCLPGFAAQQHVPLVQTCCSSATP